MNFDEQNQNTQEPAAEEMEVMTEETAINEAKETDDNQATAEDVSSDASLEEPVESTSFNKKKNDKQNKQNKPKKKKTWQQEVLEWIYCLGIAALVAFLLITFVGQIVDVSGSSMEPTLDNGDKLILYKLGYTPKKGDVVVVDPKGDTRLFIKRVIATPGDTVEAKYAETKMVDMDRDETTPDVPMAVYDVYVNGEKLDEPYIKEKIRDNTLGALREPQTVPDGHVFVLGDNRNNSDDSRDAVTVGMVSYDSIKGKAIFRIWPLGKMGPIH